MSNREPVHIRVSSPGQLLSVVPRMLGFVPEDSLVVVGLAQPREQVGVVFRYDLPPAEQMPQLIEHATSILARENMTRAVVVGYGTGPEVTPRIDAFRQGAARAGLELTEVLRVDEGRWWSYLCTSPSCHPVEGIPLDAEQVPAASLDKVGPARASREALADSIAPLTGRQETQMRDAQDRAARAARKLAERGGPQAVKAAGLQAVQGAIATYREGGTVSDDQHAWIGQALTDLQVRDDAWARMDPGHARAHTRLWTDAVRRAQPGYAAAPATLLAVTAYQQGQGALANVALDRAEEDDPGYSMAHLLGRALDVGVRPSDMAPPMTPEEVAAAYEPTPDIEAGA